MDKREYKRVVLIMGLLFLTMLLCGLLFFFMDKELQSEKERIMGQLLVNHPEMEQEIIGAFKKPDSKSAINDKAVGRKLNEKYGYEDWYRGIESAEIKYMAAALLIMLGVSVLTGFILVNALHKHYLQKQEEEKTREQIKELRDNNQVLLERLTIEEEETKALVTDISHQLKTPLASLKMSYEIAQSDKFTEAEKSVFLKQGRNEINKLEVLLEALLNLARLEKNMIQIKPELSNIKKTVFSAVNSIYIKAHDKQIDIVAEEFEDITVMHDPRWTQEALVNILDNAVKYSKPQTTVRIKVSVMVTYIIIEIADEGIGIPAKDFSNIFKRFYRGNSEIAKNSEGSGVGLYLVRKIIEEQGGSVCAKAGKT